MPSNHLILCRTLLLLPSIFPSIRVFSNESSLHVRWPKYWSFSISSSNEYSESISFKIDWFDCLALQGTLKSFLQHHTSQVSIFHHSAFLMVQLSHPYMTSGKIIALTIWNFVVVVQSSVMSDSLSSHGLQHARPLCSSPSPRVCPSSYSLHRWCHPAISSSDALFSFCPQSFPASGTFSVDYLFSSDDQNTGASDSASLLPVNIQGWSPLRLTGLISLLSKGLSAVFSSTTVQRHQFFGVLPSLQFSSHNCRWP